MPATLTGVHAQENQARRLLHDIAGFRARPGGGAGLSETVVAGQWVAGVYEPAVAAIPADLRGDLEPAEMFHQILGHRGFLSEAARRDVGMGTAVASYVDTVLRAASTPGPDGDAQGSSRNRLQHTRPVSSVPL